MGERRRTAVRLRTTFGGSESIVTATLTGVGEATELRLDHTVPLALAQSVAAALFVGPGWDGAFLGSGRYVADSGATSEETAVGRHAAVAQFVPRDLDA